MNIILITGSLPPDICGVGDYTFKLYQHLQVSKSNSFQVYYKKYWNLNLFWKYFSELKAKETDYYHMQYPTEGYKYSIVPLLLIVFLPTKKTVATIHELSSRNFLAYLYTQFLIFFAGKIIVSNAVEKRHAVRFLAKKSKVVIIPISSNIKESTHSARNIVERNIDVANFGHIRPQKGIEDFLDTMTLIPSSKKTAIIGQTLSRFEQFYKKLSVSAKEKGVDLIINMEEDRLAEVLADVKIMYLPFPDGVSNRRGSLLASIQNGCTVVTTKSEHQEFNDYFEKYCFLSESNVESAKIINGLLELKIEPKKIKTLKEDFSWDNILKLHSVIYKSKK